MGDLMNVDVALGLILDEIMRLDAETIPLDTALGRVLATDIIAGEDAPPFPTSAMDGFGVIAEDVAGAGRDNPAVLDVVADIQAGDSPMVKLSRGQAVRIMTGALVPDTVTAVIPIEQTDGDWQNPRSSVRIYTGAAHNANIRPAGENISAGQVIAHRGATLRPQDIGILAVAGQAMVPVLRQSRVAIMSTGDELVRVDQPLMPGKIRDCNCITLASLVTAAGGIPYRLPIVADTREAVRAAFEYALDHQPDMIISSGGVSMGAVDFVREILEEIGAVDFWRINLKPGKPLAFGKLRDVPFFGLPGNPVSVMVTFDVLVKPALLKQMNRGDELITRAAILQESVKSDGRRTYLRVTLKRDGADLHATPVPVQSSGALWSMVIADGLLVLPEGIEQATAGESYPVRVLRAGFEE